jgi:hypothetical protein
MSGAMLGSIVTLLIPLWIILGLVAILGLLALLGRIQNGKYLRPVILFLMKVPILKKGIQKASNAAIEKSNPELASAMKKMEKLQRTGALRDPAKAQSAMSQLTREERRALHEVQEQQGLGLAPEATNRQMRRQLEKQQKNARRPR